MGYPSMTGSFCVTSSQMKEIDIPQILDQPAAIMMSNLLQFVPITAAVKQTHDKKRKISAVKIKVLWMQWA